MGLGLTIGGWFAPEIIAKLISITFSYLGDQYNRQSDAIDDLQRLQQAHPKIRAVVSAAKQGHIKNHTPELNRWLSLLTDAADDAENILDELLYLKLEQQAKSGRNKVRHTASRFKKTMRNAIRIDPTLEKLKGVVKKLVVVADNVDVFLKLIGPHQEPRTANTRETSSLLSVPSGKVLGREMERGELMKQLQRSRLDSNSGDLAVIPVVGMGGIGKTTLVQHVYNDKTVEEYFDLRMWVCVSDVCDVGLLTRKMIESATGVTPQVSSLDMLQRSLAKELVSKRFLLVLDDVWNDKDWNFWEKLFAPLRSGLKDSKVVVTTRMEVIANAMKGVVETLSLDRLSDEDCWLLLKERAFNNEGWNDNHQLCSIGYRIASKLKGSPLAAKTLGGLLRSKLDEDHWRDILESDMLDLEQGETDIMPVLRLSYQHLPPHLQSCFAYCSIFPQDYCFLKKDLVLMWVAAGLIQELPKAKETIEDVGYKYLEELVNKSFLDHYMDTRDCFVMHDLLHDLARYVSSGECLRVAEGATGDIPNTIRHLSLSINEPFELYKLLGIKHLRTLHLSLSAGGLAIHDALRDVFQSSKGLHVLKLSSYCEIKLPAAIGDLIHLRYLNLSGADCRMLPESISQLYHLQVLKAGERLSSRLEFIPQGLNNLISLRYVTSDYVVSMIPGIRKLASLQELSEFNVKRKRGYRIEELNTMTELRELGIGCLEHVISYQEACSAKLNKKEHLNSLVLKWGWDADISWALLDERVLDGLQPHANLKNLTIEFYTGSRSPFWMNASMIPNVKCLYLNNCDGWEYLPPLEQLPHLRVLHLRQMSALKQFGPCDFQGDRVDIFPSLKELRIEEMPELTEWFGVEDCWFPHLQELSIKSCPKLMELPALPPSLIMLDIKGTGLLTLPQWPWVHHENGIEHNSYGAEVLRRSSPLRSVFLQDCMELASLGCSELLLSVKKMRITGCPTLNAVTLPVTMEAEEGFSLPLQQLIIDYTSLLVILPVLIRSITSLRSVTIYKCFNITSLPAEVEQWLLQNNDLEELELYGADSLQTLPRDMQCLGSLRSLYLANAYELESLPDLPASLEQLNFFGYSSPMLQRCSEGSAYWSKIAHIRNVCFVFGGSRSIQ